MLVPPPQVGGVGTGAHPGLRRLGRGCPITTGFSGSFGKCQIQLEPDWFVPEALFAWTGKNNNIFKKHFSHPSLESCF